MQFSVRGVFDSRRSVFFAAPLLALVSFIPSWILMRTAAELANVLGYHVANLLPSFKLYGITLVVAIVLGPLFEAFLLSGGLWIICNFTKRPWVASFVSSLFWAGVHGYQAPLWALGVVWPFFVFSYAYLAWRPRSLSDAIGIAWLAHSIHNALAVAFSYLL